MSPRGGQDVRTSVMERDIPHVVSTAIPSSIPCRAASLASFSSSIPQRLPREPPRADAPCLERKKDGTRSTNGRTSVRLHEYGSGARAARTSRSRGVCAWIYVYLSGVSSHEHCIYSKRCERLRPVVRVLPGHSVGGSIERLVCSREYESRRAGQGSLQPTAPQYWLAPPDALSLYARLHLSRLSTCRVRDP